MALQTRELLKFCQIAKLTSIEGNLNYSDIHVRIAYQVGL